MEMSSTIYAKGIYPNSVTNNGLVLNRSNSKIECAGLCSVNDDCHFYSWNKDEKQCDMEYVEKGWHFNYTETHQGQRNIYMDTGVYSMKTLETT